MKFANASRHADEAASWMLRLPMLAPETLTAAGSLLTAKV